MLKRCFTDYGYKDWSMILYRPPKDVVQYAESEAKSRSKYLTEKAEKFFRQAAAVLSVDLEKPYSIEEIKKLPKSKVSVSDVVSETRAEHYTANIS